MKSLPPRRLLSAGAHEVGELECQLPTENLAPEKKQFSDPTGRARVGRPELKVEISPATSAAAWFEISPATSAKCNPSFVEVVAVAGATWGRMVRPQQAGGGCPE